MPHERKYAKACTKTNKKCKVTRSRMVRITTLMRKTIQGHFDSFKPTELIAKLGEKFTGIKGISESLIKEIDSEVKLSEDRNTLRWFSTQPIKEFSQF